MAAYLLDLYKHPVSSSMAPDMSRIDHLLIFAADQKGAKLLFITDRKRFG